MTGVDKNRVNRFLNKTLCWMFVALLLGAASYLGWAYSLDISSPERAEGIHVKPPEAAPGERVTVMAKIRTDLRRECAADTNSYFVDSNKVEHYVGSDSVSGYARNAMFRNGFDGPEVPFDLMIPLLSSPGYGYYLRRTRFYCSGYPDFRGPIESQWTAPINVLEAKK